MNTNDLPRNYVTMGGEVRPRRPATFYFKNEAGDTVFTKTTVASADNGVIYQEPNVMFWSIAQPGQRLQVFADFHTRCGGDDVKVFNRYVGAITTFPAAPVKLNPKYLVLSVAYAPPGRQSFVDYGNSTTLGARLSFSETFQTGITQSNKKTTGVKTPLESSTSFTQTAQSTAQFAVSDSVEKAESHNIVIPGPADSLDGIDHNEDRFFLWLNPAFTVTATSPTSVETDGFSVDPRDPVSPNTDIVVLSVRQLKNPSLISPGDASRLQRSWSPTGALTTEDFNDILARNPFASGSTTIDPARFDLLPGAAFSYTPAAPGGQPITERHSVRFQAASSQSLSFNTSVKFEFGLGTTSSNELLKLKTENEITKTLEVGMGVTLDETTAANQTTTLSLTGPTTGYQGPTAVQVYQDNLFGTLLFAFAPVATFQIGAPSPSQTVTQGGSAAYPITTQSDFGFTGNVSFNPTVMGLPAGAQAAFSPASVAVGGGSTLTVTTTPQTPPGTYPLTITASSGLITRHLTVNLVVNPLPFTLSATPSSRTLSSGQSTTYTVTVTPAAGFNGPVQLLGPGGLPPGTTATYSPATITGSGSSTLTVATSASTPSGSSTLNIRATGGGVTQTTTAGLIVDNTQDFDLTVSPQAAGVAAGDTATYTATTTGINGFGGNVNLTVSGLPPGATPSFSVNPIAGAGMSTLLIATTTSTAPGDYDITVTGTSGSLSHSQTVTLTVSPPATTPDFTLAVTPSTQSATPGHSTTFPVSTAPVADFTGSIGLTLAGLPAGVTAGFDNPSVNAGSGATLAVTVDETAATGTYPLTITGVSGGLSHSQTATLSVTAPAAPDFMLNVDPSELTVPQGTAAVVGVGASSVGGLFDDGIELSIDGLPDGVNAAFDYTSIFVDSVVSLYIGADTSTAPGTYAVMVTGTSGNIPHRRTIMFTVT
jgi:uncharacterized membrane protein